MEWKEYSLPHVMIDQYKQNTDKSYSRFGGDSYFLAYLSNHKHLRKAMVTWCVLTSIPTLFLGPWVMLVVLLSTYFCVAVVLSALDTYSKRKHRVRINMKKSLEWIFDPEAHTKRRGWWQ